MLNKVSEDLRKTRNEAWMKLALAAKENSINPKEICQQWSLAANALLTKAFDVCFDQQKTGKVALFGLGKLGSLELNLSSDVDLLIVSEESTSEALSALRKFQNLLSERTAFGFVFRVDFDLRPGGKQGPLIPTFDQLRDYYGNYGETWERMAFVRLNGICGAQGLINDVLNFAKKFSYRRHLDFTLFDDLKHLRSKIQGHYWARSQNDMIDLKLGVGGIRDVELFAHALQVVHGGRDHSLQMRGTTEALELLAAKKLLPEDEAAFLKKHYWNLRCLENYVQALEDQQTHLIKVGEQYPDFITKALQTLPDEMRHCDQIVKTLLGEPPAEVNVDIAIEEELGSAGLDQKSIQELWQDILGQEVISHNRSRDESSRKAFLHEFILLLKEQGGDRHRALLFLKDFIRSTRAKATFFRMLIREKDLMRRLAWLFGHSAYLSKILCHRPELLDSFIFRSHHPYSEDMGQLLDELAEKKLLSELINGSHFLETKDLNSLLKNLTDSADSIATTLLEAIKKEYPSSLQILALGKWGGKEIGFRSDLDFIFVLPDEPVDNDYKVAKRFITRITESHRGGNIFSIDMRLRPSGKAGPLVIPLSDLQNYLDHEAQAWERQAYLKARWIGQQDQNFNKNYIGKELSDSELQELNRIRIELAGKANMLNLKYSEGGMVDIELAAQAYVLKSKKTKVCGTTTEDFLHEMGCSADALTANYARLRQIEQMFQLVASESTSEVNANHESFQALALVLHQAAEKLEQEIQQILSDNIGYLKELDPRRQSQ